MKDSDSKRRVRKLLPGVLATEAASKMDVDGAGATKATKVSKGISVKATGRAKAKRAAKATKTKKGAEAMAVDG